MVDNSFLQGAGGPRPVSGPGRSEVGAPTRAKPESAAFKTLLDKLESQARDLAEASESVASPAELAGLVDSAKESLDDALSLSDRLLEAYRATRQGSGESAPGGPGASSGGAQG